MHPVYGMHLKIFLKVPIFLKARNHLKPCKPRQKLKVKPFFLHYLVQKNGTDIYCTDCARSETHRPILRAQCEEDVY